MKSLILAGGFATRLRPLSCSKPKLMFPLVGIPLIDHMIEWLARNRVEDVILAVNHLSERLRFEVAARKLGERVRLSVEANPLGTGGPLRLAAPFLSAEEPVVVVNGDVVSNIDLKDLIATHLRSDAEATIALVSASDTRQFGLATIDSNDRIIGFEEKSQGSKGPGLINAGIYVLNPNVIKMIPSDRMVSLEREIFPVLAQQMKLAGWKHAGFWYDIGTIQDYVTANMQLLERPDSLMVKREKGFMPIAGIENPSYVGDDCVIEKGARLGPRSILSPSVKAKTGAMVRETIVFEESSLGESCRIEGSVIGEGVTVGRRARIGQGSVIAGEVALPDGAIVNPGSIVLN